MGLEVKWAVAYCGITGDSDFQANISKSIWDMLSIGGQRLLILCAKLR